MDPHPQTGNNAAEPAAAEAARALARMFGAGPLEGGDPENAAMEGDLEAALLALRTEAGTVLVRGRQTGELTKEEYRQKLFALLDELGAAKMGGKNDLGPLPTVSHGEQAQ